MPYYEVDVFITSCIFSMNNNNNQNLKVQVWMGEVQCPETTILESLVFGERLKGAVTSPKHISDVNFQDEEFRTRIPNKNRNSAGCASKRNMYYRWDNTLFS